MLFGGVHVIFCGGFFQLPPVKGRPVYDDGRLADGDNATGRDLWRRVLNAAVVLTESHRAKLDPAFAELLRILRRGSTDERVWKLVKRAVISCTRSAGASQDKAGKAWVVLARRAAAGLAAATDQPRPAAMGDVESQRHLGSLRRLDAVVEGAQQQRVLRAWRIWARTEVMVITLRNRHRIAINREFARKHIKAVNETVSADAMWRERGVLLVVLVDGVFHRHRPHDRNPPRYGVHWQRTWRCITPRSRSWGTSMLRC